MEYFRRLREAAPEAWILAEKILQPGEFLRESWPIEGTSGYDFLNVAAGVLLRHEGMEALRGIYARFSGEPLAVRPTIFFSGSSDEARAVAARHAEVQLLYGEPPPLIAELASRFRDAAEAQGFLRRSLRSTHSRTPHCGWLC